MLYTSKTAGYSRKHVITQCITVFKFDLYFSYDHDRIKMRKKKTQIDLLYIERSVNKTSMMNTCMMLEDNEVICFTCN